MSDLSVTGSDQLRALVRDLRAAGSPGRGLRSKLARNLRGAAQPIKTSAQSNARAIPVNGDGGSTGLRQAIANATRVRVLTGGRNPTVRVEVAPSRMPASQRSLPQLMEGVRAWRKPLFGNRADWYSQAPHTYFTPAVNEHLPGVQLAALEAVEQTAAIIERGGI